MDGGAWWAAVHGVTKGRTRLSDFTFTLHCHALEKAMATHSSILAWRIPGTGEPGGLPSMGSQSRTPLKRLSSSSKALKPSQTDSSSWANLSELSHKWIFFKYSASPFKLCLYHTPKRNTGLPIWYHDPACFHLWVLSTDKAAAHKACRWSRCFLDLRKAMWGKLFLSRLLPYFCLY